MKDNIEFTYELKNSLYLLNHLKHLRLRDQFNDHN